MSLESEAVASATIELLEARLRRLSYLLTGGTDWTGVPSTPEKPASLDETVSCRLARLERELEKLSRNVPAVRDVIQLRMYNRLPSTCPRLLPYSIYPDTLAQSYTQKSILTTLAHYRRPLPRPLQPSSPPLDPRRPHPPHPHLNRPLLRNSLPRNRLPPHIPQRPADPGRNVLVLPNRPTTATRPARAETGRAGG